LETFVGSRVHLVGAFISFEKNFYRLPFTPPSLVRRIGPSLAPPRASLCLARGPDTPSCETPPRSRPPPTHDVAPTPLTRAQVKGDPRHDRPSDTAWESYPGVVPPTRAMRPSPALCGSCAGRPVSTPRHCTTHSRTASTSHPSKEDEGTLERGTTICPAPAQDGAVTSDQRSASPPSLSALCGHPRHCATFLGTATPSPALWEPVTTRHCHTGRCASSSPPSSQPSS
jgi:hypothetical protein